LHFKNAIAFGTIAALAFVQVMRSPEEEGRERLRQLLALTAPILVLGIGYELTIRAWYESWLPTRMVQPGNAVLR
jgi:hypothetical protein